MRSRRVETEEVAATEAEEGSGDVLAGIINLRIETAGTEEEAAEGIGQGTADGGCVGQEKRGRGRGWRESTGTGSP